MDTTQWRQGIGVVKPMERSRPQTDQALNCPRCNSTNTKFCYYNNYSLSQPRYFCKTCRRYWTEGGSLRNVPVGGGSRKNKRSSSTTSAAAESKKLVDLAPPCFPRSASQNPKIHEGQDLNLAYPPPPTQDYNTLSTSTSTQLNAMELMKSTGIGSRGLSEFVSIPVTESNSTGFPMQDFKPSLNFSLDGFETGYGSLQSGARLLFPMEELKQVQSSSNELEQNRGQGESTGYWGEMLGGTGHGHW